MSRADDAKTCEGAGYIEVEMVSGRRVSPATNAPVVGSSGCARVKVGGRSIYDGFSGAR